VTQIVPEVDEVDVPQVLPTIIHLKIETNTSIKVTSTNPKFNYSFSYGDGIHFINIPYLNKPID
jgi:hypothetical protein